MSLYKLAILMEDVPGGGTRFPGYQTRGNHSPPPKSEAAPKQADLPNDERTLVAAAVDAVRLFQLGITAGGELNELLTASAERLYRDSRCGSVPVHELFNLIQRHWPLPPPSPPLQLVQAAVGAYLIDSRSGHASEVARRAGYGLIHWLLCKSGPCPPIRTDGMGTGPHTMPSGQE